MEKTRGNVFWFRGYDVNYALGVVKMQYADDQAEYEEVWNFGKPLPENVETKAATQLLWVLAGVSYFKARLGKEIKIKEGFEISKDLAKLAEKVWKNGLGEFFFVNKLSPIEISIPYNKEGVKMEAKEKSEKGNKPYLIPLGGGKDSLTSVMLAENANINFKTWTVNQSEKLKPQIEKIKREHVAITRKICPKLIEENKKEDVWNGHVPVTMILSAAGVVSALAERARGVILSNEKSASEGNTNWKGMEINHQWSKSWEAEKLFADYISKFVSADLEYFSLLRTLTEKQIVEIFVKEGWSRFGKLFTSCNKNFALKNTKKQTSWCGDCPKCAFVWVLLSPVAPKNDLIEIFGEDLFKKESLKKEFDALMGKAGKIKPLECVGTPKEVIESLNEAKGHWNELQNWDIPKLKKSKNEKNAHGIPKEIFDQIF